jgi:hypothetical protein
MMRRMGKRRSASQGSLFASLGAEACDPIINTRHQVIATSSPRHHHVINAVS